MKDTLETDAQIGECSPFEECILRAVKLVNNYICLVHNSAMYATLFFGVLDTDSGMLHYLSAGHDPPFVVRSGEIHEEIRPTGPTVGMFEGAPFEIASLTLEPSDSLMLYSDGIPDAQNSDGEMLGKERFRNLIQQPNRTPSDTFAKVLTELENHLEGSVQYDDITLLMVNRD
jgi:sigma-B regulation protein RsbU (phosphoserine phosphatase)